MIYLFTLFILPSLSAEPLSQHLHPKGKPGSFCDLEYPAFDYVTPGDDHTQTLEKVRIPFSQIVRSGSLKDGSVSVLDSRANQVVHDATQAKVIQYIRDSCAHYGLDLASEPFYFNAEHTLTVNPESLLENKNHLTIHCELSHKEILPRTTIAGTVTKTLAYECETFLDKMRPLVASEAIDEKCQKLVACEKTAQLHSERQFIIDMRKALFCK